MTKYQVTTISVDNANAIGATTRDMTDREARLWQNAERLLKALKAVKKAHCQVHDKRECEYCWDGDICAEANSVIAEIELFAEHEEENNGNH